MLRYGERGVVDRTVLVELLVHVLHLDDYAATGVCGAVHVEDGAALMLARTQVLTVLERDIGDDTLAGKKGIEKAYQQFLVEF